MCSTQWATVGASFVGQVVWNTEPVRFFSLDILFFSARPRRFGEKKVTRNIEKKAHGLSYDLSKFSDDFTPFFRLWKTITKSLGKN